MPTQDDLNTLANALLTVKHALESANICLSGTTVEEKNQYAANGQFIYLLTGKISQVSHGAFNMPAGIVAWVTAATTLRTDTTFCADRTKVIADCQALINMVGLDQI